MKLFRPFLYRACFFLVPIVYIGVTYLVGENHPFSTFQMYSQFPASADYFYLADSANKPISAYRKFNFRTNELKDMIQIKVKNEGLDRDSNGELSIAAREVLRFVISDNSNNSNLIRYSQLKIIRHEIKRVDTSISESDVVLAVEELPVK